MKHNEIILRNQAHPRLTATTTTSAGNGSSQLFIDTGHGTLSFGPGNSTYSHFDTSVGRFYFNKRLIVNEGIVSSYDEDLILQRAESTSTPYIKITSSKVHNTGFTHIGNATATGYATDDGSWAARLNVASSVHSKIEVSQEANSMRSHWYAHTGHTGIKFGTSSNHHVEFQRNGSTHLTMDGGLKASVPFRRGAHNTGHLEGSYNNVGANGSKTNPIYTIGNNYNPSEAVLSNMYGIGYCRADQASYVSMGGASNWGMYVAADGDARIFLDGGNGHVVSSGEHYAGDGTATNPAFSFINDTNTGMYRYAANQIGFATAGTHRMSIDSTGLRLSTGYYIAQASGETTDFKSNAASNYMRLRNNGGTIHGGVYGSGTEIGFLDRDGQWAIRHAADSHTYFYINNSERVHIDNDGLDIVQGSLMMSGQHAVREKYYSGTSNIGASGSWYTLCYITENATPAYISLKYAAHSTQTFVVTTGYHGSNVASIQMLSGTWTQNGGYPGASAVRILKDSNNNYRFQLQLTYSSGPTAFTLYARAWGGTPVNDIVNFESSLTVDTTTGSTIDSMNTNYSGSGSSRSHRGANGSAGNPAYTFHQDSDTGMYLNGTGNIGFASAGTTRAQISSSKLTVLGGTGIDLQTSSGNVRGLLVASESVPHLRIATSGNESIGFYDGGTSGTENVRIDGAGHVLLYNGYMKVPNGDAANPSYTFKDDGDSGMFSLGSNAVGFSTGGTQRFKINSNGLLITGSSALYVNGQSVINSSRQMTNLTFYGGSTGVRFARDIDLQDTGGVKRLRFNSAGSSVYNATGTHTFQSSGTTKASIDSSGSAFFTANITNTDGYILYKRTANAPLIVDRLGTSGSSGTGYGDQINLKARGNKNGAIAYKVPYGGIGYRYSGDWGLGYYQFSTSRYVQPCDTTGAIRDNQVDLGSTSSRFDDVYATNGSIQTSDRNEKQDIQALTTAEQAAAVACKALVRRFRWIDSVEEKGDNARYHFGVIAQDVEAAFTAQGLDAGRYGLFIRTNWWEHENTWYPDEEAAPEGAVERSRLGIRYNQLLAFIISAL